MGRVRPVTRSDIWEKKWAVRYSPLGGTLRDRSGGAQSFVDLPWTLSLSDDYITSAI